MKREGDNGFLRMQPPANRRGHLGVRLNTGKSLVGRYPVISFDFRASPRTAVDLIVSIQGVQGRYRGIGLTDDMPHYARLTQAPGINADGRWRHVAVNLQSLLASRLPAGAKPRLRSIELVDWNGGERLFGTKSHGQSAMRGGSYDIDNLRIGKYCASGDVTFKWACTDDSGVVGYSFLLDGDPLAVPEATVASTRPEKSYECLADGRWWFHVRAKDGCGNWAVRGATWRSWTHSHPWREWQPTRAGPRLWGST